MVSSNALCDEQTVGEMEFTTRTNNSSLFNQGSDNDTTHDHSEIDIDADLDTSATKNELQVIGTCNLMIKFSSEGEKKNLFIRVIECTLNTPDLHVNDNLHLTFIVDNSSTASTKTYPVDQVDFNGKKLPAF